MNVFSVTGRINEPKYTPGEHPRLEFGIADRYWDRKAKEEKVQWINCIFWGPPAERAAPHLAKGSRVSAYGVFRKVEYKNRHGEQMAKWQLTIQELDLEPIRKRRDGPAQVPDTATPYSPEPQHNPALDDDDIPF